MPDPVKLSRMELRLEAEIAAAPHTLEADCKRAELAAYRARLGRLDTARAELGVLRQKYERAPHILVSSWLHLLDALIDLYSDLNAAAREKFVRAQALSRAANLPKMHALCSAWLAHMDYLQLNVKSMALNACEALSLASQSDHGARSRASLVVAQAYHFADRLDLALTWYGEARAHALKEGDEATISALIHNMTWLRAQQSRIRCLNMTALAPDAENALLGAQSSANFDLLIGCTSLPALASILRAQILTTRGQYAEALELFEINLTTAVRDGMARLHADWLADQSWCRLQLDQRDGALDDALAAEAKIDPSGQFDDRALAHARLARVFVELGYEKRAALHNTQAEFAMSGHTFLQGQILAVLQASFP